MSSRLISPPTALAVDLAEAKQNLRIDGTDMDALVTQWIKGTTGLLEQEIGQCLMMQTWEVSLDEFPTRWPTWHHGPEHRSDGIRLPHPVKTVQSVSYIDEQGQQQALPEMAWMLDADRYSTHLRPARGTSWPRTSRGPGAVVITVDCGYGEDATATPDALKLYILAKLVQQFDPVSTTPRDLTSDTVQAKFIEGLLDAFRSYP